jgi:hypothetical protein
VLDAQGRIRDALGATPSLDLGQLRSSLKANGLQVLTVFRAPEGTADLRFLVRVPTTGRAASLRAVVPIEAAAPAWPVTPPLFMNDPSSRVVVPVASRANPQLEVPFRVGPKPFLPEVQPVFRNGSARDVCLLSRLPGSPALEVLPELRAADGKVQPVAISGPVRLVKDLDGAFRIVLSLAPSGVPAGEYALRVTLRDDTGQEVTSAQTVAVR